MTGEGRKIVLLCFFFRVCYRWIDMKGCINLRIYASFLTKTGYIKQTS